MSRAIYDITIRHFLSSVGDLLADKDVSEVMINGTDSIYFERSGRVEKTKRGFVNERMLMAAIRNIGEYVGKPITDSCRSLDARLPSGERVHAIWPPCSRTGVCLTIRKFNHASHSLDGLIQNGALSQDAARFLELSVITKKNVLISGGTGTGKTTFLNALSEKIPENERIIVIEDSSELVLRQKHAIYLEAQAHDEHGKGGASIRDLFVDSLRMRPDRIIVGEVRRGEALDLIQSMISGHSGALSTVHASTPNDAASRLETLCLLSDTGMPVHVARAQVASAVDLVVQLIRHPDGQRYVKTISECLELDEKDRYQWRDLFRRRMSFNDHSVAKESRLLGCGNRPSFEDDIFEAGLAARYGQINFEPSCPAVA